MASRSRVRIDPRRCDRCGRCLAACAQNAIRVGRTFIAIDPIACDGCAACVSVCARGALWAEGKRGAASQPAPVLRTRPSARARGSSAATPRARTRAVADAAEAPGWSLLEALAMLSVTLAAFVGKEVLLALAPVRALPVGALVLVRAAVLGGYYAVQLAALRWLAARHGSTVRELLVGRSEHEPSRTSVLWAAAAVLVGTRAFAIMYGLVMRSAGVVPDSSALLETFGSEPAGLVLAAALVVFVGPVVEEMVFRGVLLRGLEGRFGTPLAIAIQAVVFAALHRSAWLFVPMAVLGASLGWLAQRSRGLVPPVLVHASYNAVTVLAALALRG